MSKYFDLTDIKKIKPNPDNPRVIKDEAYQKLVKSIQDFPQMLELRPIVIDEAGVILGGNMRYRACIDAGMKKVPTVQADTLTEEQKREFIIKDNVGFGDWDWEALDNWDEDELSDWGLNIPKDTDYFDVEPVEALTMQPRPTDDAYSTFELVMLHENKIQLLDTLNLIKQNYLFEKHEDALMELIRIYNKQQDNA